jgi:hypothetical protein
MLPTYSPMMINMKYFIVRELVFIFQGGGGKTKFKGTTALEQQTC